MKILLIEDTSFKGFSVFNKNMNRKQVIDLYDVASQQGLNVGIPAVVHDNSLPRPVEYTVSALEFKDVNSKFINFVLSHTLRVKDRKMWKVVDRGQ